MKNKIEKLLREQLIKEGYFNLTIDDDIKKLSARYVGKNVTWYGDKEQMIVLTADEVHGTWGNIYNKDKLAFVKDMVKSYDNNNVEFECSYGIGSVIDFTEILEEQTSSHNEDFLTDYDGKKTPASTGDQELDTYVGTEEISDLPFIADNDVEEVMVTFFEQNRFSLIYEKSTEAKLRYTYLKLAPDKDETVAFDEFIRFEKSLKEAETNDGGDFNKFTVQLRDGHHRVFGALEAGENFVCVRRGRILILGY
jgi:hypothetical protein